MLHSISVFPIPFSSLSHISKIIFFQHHIRITIFMGLTIPSTVNICKNRDGCDRTRSFNIRNPNKALHCYTILTLCRIYKEHLLCIMGHMGTIQEFQYNTIKNKNTTSWQTIKHVKA